MRCLVLVVIALSVCCVYAVQWPSGYNQGFCSPPPHNGGRNFPGLPKNFMAEIDWVDHIAKRSTLMKVYASPDLNTGAIFVTGLKAPGVTSKYITLGETGELVIIPDVNNQGIGNCFVKNLSKTDEFSLPYFTDRLGNHQVQGFKSYLNIGATPIGPVIYMYIGAEERNGVTCDVWQACLFIPSGSITLSVKYYFAENSWSSASGSSVKPIAVYLKGVSEMNLNYQLEQTFNYNYFSEELPPFQEVFQMPEHAYCPGKKSTLAVPKVPPRFSFVAEIVNHVANTVTYSQEYISVSSNYSKFDLRQKGAKKTSVTNDFTTGESYLVEDETKCDHSSAILTFYDSKVDSEGKTRMRTPEEFFNMDNQEQYPYQYVGEYQVRGILADSWISYRPITLSRDQKDKPKATVQWYFTSETSGSSAKPLKVILKTDQNELNVTYNIFDFNDNPEERFTDIPACLSQFGSRTFKMDLTANGSLTAANSDVKEMKRLVTNSIADFSSVRSLRLQDIQVKLRGNGLRVTFTLYGAHKGVSLQMASQNFVKSFTTRTFKVRYMTKSNVVLMLLPVQDSLREIGKTEWPVYAVSNEAIG